MNQAMTYWPVFAGAFAVIGGIAGFVVALLKIRQLQLSIEKLEKEMREAKNAVYHPTVDEIEKYGKTLEIFAVESERVFKRHNEITKMFSQQIDVQIETEREFKEQTNKSFRLFDEWEYRIKRLREKLSELATDLGHFSEKKK